MKASVSVLKMLDCVIAMLQDKTGRKGSWEQAYVEIGKELGAQLREINSGTKDHVLAVQLNELADFYGELPDDPEMGTFDQGREAVIRDFAIALISAVRGHEEYVEHDRQLDALLTTVTD